MSGFSSFKEDFWISYPDYLGMNKKCGKYFIDGLLLNKTLQFLFDGGSDCPGGPIGCFLDLDLVDGGFGFKAIRAVELAGFFGKGGVGGRGG